MTNAQRLTDFYQWIRDHHHNGDINIRPLAGDASFRHYYRVEDARGSLIAVESVPALEDQKPFVELALIFAQHDLRTPKILAQDLTKGYVLQEDFGDELYSAVLNEENALALYQLALTELVKIQQIPASSVYQFPMFDEERYFFELNNFTHWFVDKLLGHTLTPDEQRSLTTLYRLLIDDALAQPQVCVHRDYHSRNLLRLPGGELGIIDFQDALIGPITYDIVSLIRDCYVDWPEVYIQQLLLFFYEQLQIQGALQNIAFARFSQWFDYMGMQRHMKAIFIFARKWLRDGDSNYLADIPRALGYIKNVTEKYAVFADVRCLFSHFATQFSALEQKRSVV